MRYKIIAHDRSGSPLTETIDWPSGVPLQVGFTVRFAVMGQHYEGEIKNVQVDATSASQHLPVILLENVRQA